MDLATREAFLWTRYFLREDALPEEVQLYRLALKEKSRALGRYEQNLRNLIFRFPFLLPCIDGALALLAPDGELRHRIFLMLAILETSPARAAIFLDRKRNIFSFVGLFLRLIWATLCTVVGLFIIGLTRLVWR